MLAGATNCRPFSRRDGHDDHERNVQPYIKHLQQASVLWGQWEWSHSVCHGCVTGSQIQDPALMLCADDAHMDLGKACGTNTSPNPLGGMLGRDWCR